MRASGLTRLAGNSPEPYEPNSRGRVDRGGDRRIVLPADVAIAFPPRAATATEISNKEQANVATGNYTHGATVAANGERGHTTAHERSSLSSRAGAVGRELARYGLVVIVGWIGLMKFTGYEAE